MFKLLISLFKKKVVKSTENVKSKTQLPAIEVSCPFCGWQPSTQFPDTDQFSYQVKFKNTVITIRSDSMACLTRATVYSLWLKVTVSPARGTISPVSPEFQLLVWRT